MDLIYKVSNHAKQRYAERIMDKDEKIDVNRFVTLNEDKIIIDLNKMIEHGELIYSGKSSRDNRGNVIDVYAKNCWIILVDNRAKNVVTLYKIDLGLGEEFNQNYVDKMIEKLYEKKELVEEAKALAAKETDVYKEIIEDSENQIKNYKAMIKNLEDLCTGYKLVIENNMTKVTEAQMKAAEVLNKLIDKKEF
jgi:hypothetical protein